MEAMPVETPFQNLGSKQKDRVQGKQPEEERLGRYKIEESRTDKRSGHRQINQGQKEALQ